MKTLTFILSVLFIIFTLSCSDKSKQEIKSEPQLSTIYCETRLNHHIKDGGTLFWHDKMNKYDSFTYTDTTSLIREFKLFYEGERCEKKIRDRWIEQSWKEQNWKREREPFNLEKLLKIIEKGKENDLTCTCTYIN